MSKQHRSLLVVALLSGCIGLYTLINSFAAEFPGVQVQVFDSLAQLRPDKPVPTGSTTKANLAAAKNEYESFQIMVRTGSTALTGVRADLTTPLSGTGGTIPADNVTIYREANYNVTTASDAEGGTGQWPDALIPQKDAFYGEQRNAFPVNLGANSQVAVWVDVLVPVGQAAGDYSGTVRISAANGTIQDIPVKLRVANFSIPSTTSAKSLFLMASYYPCTAHTGSYNCNGNKDEAWQLATLYAEAGLNNRTTIANPLPDIWGDSGAPAAPLTGNANTQFQQKTLPLINGTDPKVKLPGASLTTVAGLWYCAHAGTTCVTDWKNLSTQYGFNNKFWLYICDEPYASNNLWNTECKPNITRANQAWPGANKLITTDIASANTNNAASSFNTIVTLVQDMVTRSGNTNNGTSHRSEYDSYLSQPGNNLWMYTSCTSFGCTDTNKAAYYNGWPGYAIDEPASEQRAMGWMLYNYGSTGELYYNTGQKLMSAWTDQFDFGGNGDGTLFYVGNPAGGPGTNPAIGGTHEIPIESIRLKRIRDGKEDYEYLKKLGDSGKSTQAKNVIQTLFGPSSTAMFNTAVPGQSLDGARCQLLQLITGTDECAAAATDPDPDPDPTPGSVRGDITGANGSPDGKINLFDISYVIRNYNTTNAGGDITGSSGSPDGKVDLYDMSYVIRNYSP